MCPSRSKSRKLRQVFVFLFQTTVIEIFSRLYTFFYGDDLNGYIREPSDSDTVELGEPWINGAKFGIESGSASSNDKCLLKSKKREDCEINILCVKWLFMAVVEEWELF